jgi:hypothetical protein
MSFKHLLEKRKNGTTKANKTASKNFAERLKQYETEFAQERKKMTPSDAFYNRSYDI